MGQIQLLNHLILSYFLYKWLFSLMYPNTELLAKAEMCAFKTVKEIEPITSPDSPLFLC